MIMSVSKKKMILEKNGIFRNFFSVFMALYPLLCMYKGISSITMGDVLLIIFFLFGIIKNRRVKISIREKIIFFFIMYALIMLIFNILFLQTARIYEINSLLIRLIKFTFYMVCAILIGSRLIDLSLFKKTLYIIASLACLFLFVQYVFFYGSGMVIQGTIPGLPLHLDEYSLIDYDRIFRYYFRPSSFFLEPALFVHYEIVALIMVLFDESVLSNKGKVYLIALLTIGIIMSTSGQGILYVSVVFLIYSLKEIKNKVRAVGFVGLLFCVALISYNTSEVLRTAVDRLLHNEAAADARLGTYHYCFEMDLFSLLFGNGYGSTANGEYMAGAAYVWYGCGLLGLGLILLIYYLLYKTAYNSMTKVICIVFFIMFFGTGLFYNYMVFWYFSLIMTNSIVRRNNKINV